jgi:hypothetical protein
MGVLFTADLSEDTEIALSFTPSNDVSRQYNVYESYLGEYPASSTYWTDWGGWYDNPIVNQVELYIGGQWLQRVYSIEDCCTTPFSIFDESTAGVVYINVPRHTWLYNDITTTVKKTVSFLSGAKNPNNPSDDVFNYEHWPVRLEAPKLTVKLSDVISGLTKYSTFDFILHNDDGYFDDIETTNFFNAPSYIRKAWKENPNVEDFIPIRYGMVESIKIDDNSMTVSCADIFRTLEEPVSKIIKDMFPSAVENRDGNLPIVFGTVTIPLIKIHDLQYVAGENITSVSKVYDKDGNEITGFSFSNGIITVSSEAKYAVVTGNEENKIGQIVPFIIAEKTHIAYNGSFWDMDETNDYMSASPEVNIAFTGGTVQEAVKNTLSSDTVFLIQKNNGRLTLRRWGKTYNTFNIRNWSITKFPAKNYSEAQKGYFSSCLIQYNYNFFGKAHEGMVLYRENEEKAESTYNKVVRKEFKTYLNNETDAFNLGAKLSDRFSTLRETVQVSVGHNTSEINLLDTVELELSVNERKVSKYTTWTVKEIDPAQDVLTLEPVIPL